MAWLTNRKHVDAYDNSVDIEKDVIKSFKEAWRVTPSKQNFMPYKIHVIGPDAQEWKNKLYAHCLRNEGTVDNLSDEQLVSRYEHRPPSYHSITNCSFALIITQRLVTKPNVRQQKRLEKGHVAEQMDVKQQHALNSIVSFEVGLFCNALQYYLLQKNIDSCYTGCFQNDLNTWRTLPFVNETPIMIMTIGKGIRFAERDPENDRPDLDEIVNIVK
tara:strand:+ start:10953 stop:11600 length:648 start_codon:yes stop_codon:yes gene_type:complete